MNDIEKAIETLKELKITDNETRFEMARIMAISALEKKIPKKPDFIDGEIFKCPSCGWKRSISNIRYCQTCGQLLDWSVES